MTVKESASERKGQADSQTNVPKEDTPASPSIHRQTDPYSWQVAHQGEKANKQ